jgi:uncharacterized protein YfaS (alpha-2-macroglobulin family)
VRKEAAVRLADIVSKSRLGRTATSTQEQAWMLLAARGLVEEGKTLKLQVGSAEQTGALLKALSSDELAKGPFVVSNRSDLPIQAVVTVTGQSLIAEPAAAKGFKIERSFFGLDGKAVTAKNGQLALKQNDRLVVVLKVSATDGDKGRVLIVDRLPAGFEVENPRLVDSGSITNLPWLKDVARPEHTEFRDDRFVAALDLRNAKGSAGDAGDSSDSSDNQGGSPDDNSTNGSSNDASGSKAATEPPVTLLAYVVRAVTPGNYLLPAATVEDMYRPERFARTTVGQVTVAR